MERPLERRAGRALDWFDRLGVERLLAAGLRLEAERFPAGFLAGLRPEEPRLDDERRDFPPFLALPCPLLATGRLRAEHTHGSATA